MMINHPKILLILMATSFASLATSRGAGAQGAAAATGAGGAAAPPASVGIPGVPSPPAKPEEEVPPGEANSDESSQNSNVSLPVQPPPSVAPGQGAAAPIFPSAGVVRRRRVKPLRTTMGMDPTAPDFAGEADLVSIANEGTANIKPKRWLFTMHGYLRAPLTIGIGPTSQAADMAMQHKDFQLHSPANEIIGANVTDWYSVGLRPAPAAALYVSAGNALITGTIIISADTFFDVGYKKLDAMGAISQGYLTMKFPDAFGSRGGLALTGGAFSNRYGLAGPNQQSSGYYAAYLFGRTRVVGANLTADLDLTDHTELVLEVGGGSKLEVIPWLTMPVVATSYLPDQGPTPQGTNLVGHAHAALFFDETAKLAGHCVISYSNNDLSASTGFIKADPSHLWICGAEGHYDSQRFGSGYLGYAHLDAQRVLSLADGVQVIQSANGVGLTQNYLNPLWTYARGSTATAVVPGSVGDNGKIDTFLFQYIVRIASLLELPASGRDLSLAVFGMFNHVTGDKLQEGTSSGSQDKLKVGAEAQLAFWRYMTAGIRADRVMPNGSKSELAYSAISPRIVFHSSWLSREYFLLSYTRYFLGSSLEQKPFVDLTGAKYPVDKNLLVLSANIAF